MSESRDTNKNIETHEPVKLLKKKSYPTYQLHAYLNNRIDNSTALKIAVLETMSWLRKRFRELDIPNQISLPEPKNYEQVQDSDLKSFRIEEGYILDVCSIVSAGIWAMHLSEPDLGPEPGDYTKARLPVPGRVFETNIAFRIINNKVECGFKTICTEPETSDAPCEVFRPAVIKAIVRNKSLGLINEFPILEEAHKCESTKQLKNLIEFVRNKYRQQPIVIMANELPETDVNSIIEAQLKIATDVSNFNFIKTNNPSYESSKTGSNNLIDIERLAKYKMSFAQFFILNNSHINIFNQNCEQKFHLNTGDIRIILPTMSGEDSIHYKFTDLKSNPEFIVDKIENTLEQYQKGRFMNYGNIKFFNEARLEELQSVINISKSKEDIIKNYQLKDEMRDKEFAEIIEARDRLIIEKDEKIYRQKIVIDELYEQIGNLNTENENIRNTFKSDIARSQAEVSRLKLRFSRPRKPDEIEEWVNKRFSDRIYLHQRAIDELSKLRSGFDIDLLCDSLEYLSSEYFEKTFGIIDEEEHNKRCQEYYNRRFEVTPSGEQSIKMYKNEYKIKYRFSDKCKPREIFLDYHLKIGKGNENIIRIYFYKDTINKILVVGYLPGHLSTATGG